MAFLGFVIVFVGFFLLFASGVLWYLFPFSLASVVSNPSSTTLASSYLQFILNVGLSIASVLVTLVGGMVWSSAQLLKRLEEMEGGLGEEGEEENQMTKSTAKENK
jgi:hypothetical protein